MNKSKNVVELNRWTVAAIKKKRTLELKRLVINGNMTEIVKKYRSFEALVKKHGEVGAMELLKKQIEQSGLRRKRIFRPCRSLKPK